MPSVQGTVRNGSHTKGDVPKEPLDYPPSAAEPRAKAVVPLPIQGERLGSRPSPSEGREPLLIPARWPGDNPRAADSRPTAVPNSVTGRAR
jgi:hypothetical protein